MTLKGFHGDPSARAAQQRRRVRVAPGSAAMSIALKGKFADLVAKLSVKGEAQAALEGLAGIVKCEGRKAECFLVEVLVQVLDATNGKDKKVVSADADTARSVVGMASPFAFDLMMPAFLSGLSVKAKPPQKEATLNIIKDFAARNLKATGYALVTLVSPDAGVTCDIKKEGKAAAVECMSATCNCSVQEPGALPALRGGGRPVQQADAWLRGKLAGCIFVQNVETPALAATLPVLFRGLNDKFEEVRRTPRPLVGDMCKFVEDPVEVLLLMSRLEPLVKSASVEIADPEVRGVAVKAYKKQEAAGVGAQRTGMLEAKDALAIFLLVSTSLAS